MSEIQNSIPTTGQAEGPTNEPAPDFNQGVKTTTMATMPRKPFNNIPLNRKQRRARGYKKPVMSRAQNEARLKAMPRIDIDDIRKKAAEMKAKQGEK